MALLKVDFSNAFNSVSGATFLISLSPGFTTTSCSFKTCMGALPGVLYTYMY